MNLNNNGLRPLLSVAAVALLAVSASAFAKPPADPCKRVKLESGDFGGPPSWAASGFGYTLIQLKPSESGGYVLRVPAQTRELSTVVVEPGATAEVALADGTVWKDTLNSPVAGTVLNNGSGTFWHFPVKLDAERLAQLATTRVVNARLSVGDTTFGDQWFLAPWTDDLQRAAACLASKQAP